MPDCFAFDCDGTIELSNGKVKVEDLAVLASKGNHVVIVSPSSNCVPLPYPRVTNGATRKDNLLMVKSIFPAEKYYYISDNLGDPEIAKEAGFIFIHPDSWRVDR